MNASAIYSKSGKGVQEASGKTSHLSRSDRAVLSAIDGRATLADVAQKVGKPFDPAFLKLIESLDNAGFIRQVSAGSPAGAVGTSSKPAAKPTPMDAASDLDFTTALSIPKAKPTPPPAKPAPAPTAQEKALAERAAKEQQEAFQKAREEAERKAAAERERVKAEVEAKARAAAEAKARTEAEARLKAEAVAKVKAQAEAKVKAQEAAARAAAEAKAKAEAEAKKAREEAERARREAAEAAERARKEAEAKLRREQEEMRRKLEEERKAREEAERKAKEEAKRAEEERRRLEEERKAREAAERKAQEEAKRVEEERRRLEEERRKLEEERTRREQEDLMQAARAAAAKRQARTQPKPEAEPETERAPDITPVPANAASGAFSDSLLADLESFSTRDEEERKQKEEELRKEREAAVALAREVQERRAREEAERKTQTDKERRKAEEAQRKAREEAELREQEERKRQRLQEEEERRRAEAEERARKAKEEEERAAKSTRAAAYDAEMRAKRERDLMARNKKAASAAGRREPRGWGKRVAITLFLLLLIGVGVMHVVPIDTTEYERAASTALGRPVKARSANLSLFTGLAIKFNDVSVGDDLRIPVVRAYPALDALLGPSKQFSRIELDGLKVAQQALGALFFTRLEARNVGVERFVVKNLELTGPLALPKGLELEIVYADDGSVRAAMVRGPDGLSARFTRKSANFDMDMSASSFTVPFAPEIMLSRFSMKGAATAQALTVSEWDGALLNGTLSGTASVRWGDTWAVDGVVTARNINAAVFAPALLADGKGEGSGKFSMRGAPGKLAATSRLDGSFTVTRGVLGWIDLSRAIQTHGKSATGRTQFNEMNGQGTYDRGAVSLRNVTIGAGQLNAGASADIAQNGALSGRIVGDVRVASQTTRVTLNLGGTVKEPQVRN